MRGIQVLCLTALLQSVAASSKLAITKAQLSSTLWSFSGSVCIDGSVDNFCHTDGDPAWLQLDLGSVQDVSKVVIWNRMSNQDRLGLHEIWVGNTASNPSGSGNLKCFSGTAPSTRGPFHQSCVGSGRYVYVYLPGSDRTLNLAEVEIWGAGGESTGPGNAVVYDWTKQDSEGNLLPDFSYVGYHKGEKTIPTNIPVEKTLTASDQDMRSELQRAVDYVGTLPLKDGYRGAVLLKKGTYRLSGLIKFDKSGVVLRGEGKGNTLLLCTWSVKGKDAERHTGALHLGGTSQRRPTGSEFTVRNNVPVGTRVLDVGTSSHGFKKGDSVIVTTENTAEWAAEMELTQLPYWGGFEAAYEKIITAVSGRLITVDVPMTQAIRYKQKGWTQARVQKYTDPRTYHIGVEHLSIHSIARGEDELKTRNTVFSKHCVNCWVRHIEGQYIPYSCVHLSGGVTGFTVLNSECTNPTGPVTGGRRYAWNVGAGAQLSLFMNLHADSHRHSYVVGQKAAGPNAFVNCVSTNPKFYSEPHLVWSTGGLYDNVEDLIAFQYRGPGQGWAGANYVAWNTRGILRCQIPPRALTWSVGHEGKFSSAWHPDKGPACDHVSPNRAVEPKSLYAAQLKARTGRTVVLPEPTKGSRSSFNPDPELPGSRLSVAATALLVLTGVVVLSSAAGALACRKRSHRRNSEAELVEV